MELYEPKGSPWMFAVSANAGTDDLSYMTSVSGVFSTSGYYDINIVVSEYSSGDLGVYCGNTKVLNVEHNGLNRCIFKKDDNSPQEINIQLLADEGKSSVNIERVSVSKIDEDVMLYEFAERIEGVYPMREIPLHISNLFSIRIRNSNINESYSGDDKENIQKTIDNIIGNIIDKITPVHTQLFKIEWIGD
jgi:hypothetical protein